MNKRNPRHAPGADPLLDSLIDAGRAYGPSPEQVARIARGLPLRGAPLATIEAGPRRASRRARWLVTTAAISGVAAALLLGVQLASRPREPPPLARASADWPAAVPSAPPSTVAPVTSGPLSAAPALEPSAAARAAPASGGSGSSRLRAPPRPASASSTSAEAPGIGPASSPHPPTGGGAVEGHTAAEEGEGDLLDRAAIVLDRSPAEALRLADQHRAAFPSSALGPDREVLAVRALFLLGRAGEARARGARFLQQYPTSTRRRLVDAMLAP